MQIENEIDMEIIKELISMNSADDPTFFQDQRDLFVSHTKDHLGKLSAAIDQDRRNDVKEISHSLAGSCGNFGATQIAENFRELQRGSSTFDKDQMRSAELTIRQKLESFFEYLHHLNLEHPSP